MSSYIKIPEPQLLPDTVQSFARSFRRVIQLTVMLDASLDYLCQEEQTESGMASKAIDIRKSIEKLYQWCRRNAPNTWPLLEQEMASEQIQDTLLLVDEAANVINVADLVNEIRGWKEQLKKQG